MILKFLMSWARALGFFCLLCAAESFVLVSDSDALRRVSWKWRVKASSLEEEEGADQQAMLAEVSVLSANNQFYEAFRSVDLAMMKKLWSDSEEATCCHPGHPTIFGSKKIVKSWEALFSGGSMPPLRATRQKVALRGNIAWVTCLETNGDQPASLEAINIFERKDGHWFMVHHQAAPVLPVFAQQADTG